MQIAFVAILLLVLIARSRPVEWNDNYIDKRTTSTVNGLFVWLVFLSHFTQYLPPGAGNLVGDNLQQLVVVMFLFYSGYGCVVQYVAKGEAYLQTFPKKRMLATLVNFDIAVCVFVVVDLLVGRPLSLCQVLLSFICWDSVGNSNWYIFVILLCYWLFWASAAMIRHKVNAFNKRLMLLVVILACTSVLLSCVRPAYWCDTLMAFGAGCAFAHWQPRIERIARGHYLLSVAVLSAVFFLVRHIPYLGARHLFAFNVKSVVFALLVVAATMRVRIDSPVLRWSGEHLFPLYIYQRVPMIIFATLYPAAFKDYRCWFYLALSALVAICIATLYPRFSYPWVAKGR